MYKVPRIYFMFHSRREIHVISDRMSNHSNMGSMTWNTIEEEYDATNFALYGTQSVQS